MDKLFEIIKNHTGKAIGIPAVLSGLTFFGNLLLALADGVITDAEYHTLISSASGVEVLILLVLMAVLRSKK